MTVVMLSGSMVTKRLNGGEAWVRLNWFLGLRRLGIEVFFVEQLPASACVDAFGVPTDFTTSANMESFMEIADQFNLTGHAALISEDGTQIHGCTLFELLDVASACDALIDISGHLTLSSVLDRVKRRILIDEDPGFTQFWHATGIDVRRLEGYDHYFSVGANIGHPDCPIPTEGLHWQPLRQPVVLEEWPVCEAAHDHFTTVASWRGTYGALTVGERRFGAKAHEFRKYMNLPQHVDQSFEIALDIHPADEEDLKDLQSHGWRITDPTVVVPGPMEFRRYVQGSGAEFSVAQGVYVETNSGWFSDRSVRYLASGKPVLVQDTGLARTLPLGEGLLTFKTFDQAVSGVEEITRNYERHAHAARTVAETYFDSDVVLSEFLETINVSP